MKAQKTHQSKPYEGTKKPISLNRMKAQKTHQSKSSASASVPAAAWKTPHRKNIVIVVVVVPADTFPRKSSNPFLEISRREKGHQIFSKTQACDMIWRIVMKP